MFKKATVFAGLVVLSLVGVARAEEAPAPPPELKKTVEAFTGNWAMDGAVTLPGGTPTKMKMKLDCRKTALGKGVACSGTANIPGMGPWQGSFMVGYDQLTKQVHFMGVTSDEEVHDHKCAWKGDTSLECEPLKGGLGAQPATEELSFAVGPRMLGFKSTTIMKDGSRIGFEASGQRK
jgi:hypothetical protein